ncbi:MAG TPA: hypothetical protein VFC44_16580 [Candidatus Saccharimonadales bacterium]|nr:hypothetical protein [Candidatus Saccharimonadales bacterium]
MNTPIKIAKPAQEIPVQPACPFDYSICTLVTDLAEYGKMLDSFGRAGFGEEDCEFLYIDNSLRNKTDAYAGYNSFLNAARGRRIILCHQDILLPFHRRKDLERRMAELDALDPNWAVLGNAGATAIGVGAGRITHPEGECANRCSLPAPACSVDENFILVKREANLAVSHDLLGFHFYGTDLCLIAGILGWTAWVVDFHLYHQSSGQFNPAFREMKRDIAHKYQQALKGRFLQTTCTEIILGGSPLKRLWWTQWARHLAFKKIYYARKRFRHGHGPDPREISGLPHVAPAWFAMHWIAHKIIRPIKNVAGALRTLKISHLFQSRYVKSRSHLIERPASQGPASVSGAE